MIMDSRKITKTSFSAQARSIDDLIDQVGEFQAAAATEAINRLSAENALLRRWIGVYQESWSCTMIMLETSSRHFINGTGDVYWSRASS